MESEKKQMKDFMIRTEIINRRHDIQHKSPMDEIATGDFSMVEYWRECEGNTGEKWSLERVWLDLS